MGTSCHETGSSKGHHTKTISWAKIKSNRGHIATQHWQPLNLAIPLKEGLTQHCSRRRKKLWHLLLKRTLPSPCFFCHKQKHLSQNLTLLICIPYHRTAAQNHNDMDLALTFLSKCNKSPANSQHIIDLALTFLKTFHTHSLILNLALLLAFLRFSVQFPQQPQDHRQSSSLFGQPYPDLAWHFSVQKNLSKTKSCLSFCFASQNHSPKNPWHFFSINLSQHYTKKKTWPFLKTTCCLHSKDPVKNFKT